MNKLVLWFLVTLHVTSLGCTINHLYSVYINIMSFYRFKSVQKTDGFLGDNYSTSGHHNPNAAEQTVLAQSQHHQQFLGKEVEMRSSINV